MLRTQGRAVWSAMVVCVLAGLWPAAASAHEGNHCKPPQAESELESVQTLARSFFSGRQIGATVLGRVQGIQLTPDQLRC